jgi:hypothetical protein
MRVDGYSIANNATLFDGTVVETASTSATLRLEKGITVTLAPGSRGSLYRDHFALDKGVSQVEVSAPFSLQASGLHITADQPHSRALIMMKGDNTISVASIAGQFKVMDESGVTLGSVAAGKTLTFAMTPSAGSGGGGGVGGKKNWGIIIPVAAIITGFTIAEIMVHKYPSSGPASR